MGYIRLTKAQIQALISKLPQWEYLEGGATAADRVVRSYQFKSFEDSWSFLTKVAMRSHKMGHHPKITNLYNRVDLELTTHDVNGLSEIDFKMATVFEKAARRLIGE